MRRRGTAQPAKKRARFPLTEARLDAMIREATVDAYRESEQVVGFYTMIEDHLAVPFDTTLLGIPLTVKGVDVTQRDEIVAICSRGRLRQSIPILDLVMPSPEPAGAEWIQAYRHRVGAD